MLEVYQKKIIELLYKQEVLLAKLYKIFADQFPDYKDFWKELVKDELQHAKWIKKFYHAEKKDLVGFSEGKIKTSTMEIFIGHVEKVIQQAKNGEINVKMAVAYTLDFERSLIEKNVFTHFEILDKRVKEIMTKLDSETRKHIKKAEDLIDMIAN